jgi:gamma-glutamyltranspeptidase/glutathione hydrolase
MRSPGKSNLATPEIPCRLFRRYRRAGKIRLFQDGYDLQGAVDAPRLFGYNDVVQVEAGVDEASVAHLERHGHRIERLTAPLGGAQAIWIDHNRGVLVGGSDPRKDGCALGY